MIEKSRSTSLALATIAILGQPPRPGALYKPEMALQMRQIVAPGDYPLMEMAGVVLNKIIINQLLVCKYLAGESLRPGGCDNLSH
ncbi:hypothetical protein [Nitrosomonas halophila]|uniref:Uncharacterized protein n=1 Tax=Nitrosomonas halophila TaxID=44576 RepID=A0A1H3GHF3_9PROT|nr:hypothetical protein [Nitrosomonas halophila]SDY02435.1 hypothetical protein SAMN05421881_101527 [Nitrosomonas halophila]